MKEQVDAAAPKASQPERIALRMYLPHIGEPLARSIEQLVDTGRINSLGYLRDETSPGRIFDTVPGIGPKLADRIHEQLGIETLTGLQ